MDYPDRKQDAQDTSSGPVLVHRPCFQETRSIQHHDLTAIEVDDDGQITRALDLGDAQSIEVPGGDVVFVAELARTDDGAALERVGDKPVATTSVRSLASLKNALSEAGYTGREIGFACSNTLDGENGRQAARIAESREHEHPAQIESAGAGEQAMTDGGVATETASDEPTDAERGVQTAYRATCHDCSWTRTRTDVIEADDLGGEHYREKNHLTEVIEVETRAEPERSETADFGGGEGGIDEL